MNKLITKIFLLAAVIFVFGCRQDNAPMFTKKEVQHTPTYTLGNNELDLTVREYLQKQTDINMQTEDGSRKNICLFDKLDSSELFPHYLWVICEEYYWQGDHLQTGSGVSLPVKIDYPNELSNFDETKFTHQIPGDGTLYVEDIKKIFPTELQDIVLNYNAEQISQQIRQVAENEMTLTAVSE